MPRLHPVAPADTPEASRPLLEVVAKRFGTVPLQVQTLAHSPAGLKFYLGQVEALAFGSLSPQLREQIALVTAGVNHCDYCASAHTLAGKGRGITPGELADNLRGISQDDKVQAALDLAKEVLQHKGNVGNDTLQAVRDAGYSESDIVEIIAHVGMNIFTNYFNHVAQTTIDFPLVETATNP
jgi:uncharacterized peroxidase-related enzyme